VNIVFYTLKVANNSGAALPFNKAILSHMW